MTKKLRDILTEEGYAVLYRAGALAAEQKRGAITSSDMLMAVIENPTSEAIAILESAAVGLSVAEQDLKDEITTLYQELYPVEPEPVPEG